MNQLKVSVTQLTGIGTQTAQRLEKLGIRVIQDLVFHLPIRYEDRTRVVAIGSLMAGMTALVCGRIEFIDVLPRGRKGLVCRISDDTGFISLKFFHSSQTNLPDYFDVVTDMEKFRIEVYSLFKF